MPLPVVRRAMRRCCTALFLCTCLPAPIASVAADPLGDGTRDALAERLGGHQPSDILGRVLSDFYADRAYQPVWVAGGGEGKATELLSVLAGAERHGLDPVDYDVESLWRDCSLPVADNAAACELRFSRAFLEYARDAGYGRFPVDEVDPSWHIDADALQARATLEIIANSHRAAPVMQALPPAHREYETLRRALSEYRWLAELGGWDPIPGGPLIRPGSEDPRMQAIRERLALTDAALPGRAYEPGTRAAIEHFQARHGLTVDGIIGPKTLAAMNVPVEQRIAQIRLNLERWRWMPRELPRRYLMVNLPAFELTLQDQNETVMRTRAITGRADRTTPSFRSRVVGIVFNPVWHVPRSIAVNDILPKLLEDPAYLRRHRIDVFKKADGGFVRVDPERVEWHRYHSDDFPFELRQMPGPRNSLGRLKFEMPNPHAIFIHDTPTPELFSRKVRTLSSGCIRIQNPVELAAYLTDFKGQEIAKNDVISQIDSGATNAIPVTPQVPVFLVYFTAWIDDDGNIQFRDDVYNRNTELRKRFAQN